MTQELCRSLRAIVYLHMRVIIPFSLLCLLFIACNGTPQTNVSPKDPVEELRKEVMDIHDETMKYMTDIRKAKKKLRDPKMVQDVPKEEVLQALTNLQLADSLMMDWMHKYTEPSDPAQLKSYLEKELISIKKVDEAITSSMSQANKLISQ